jgi:hypothetical protein
MTPTRTAFDTYRVSFSPTPGATVNVRVCARNDAEAIRYAALLHNMPRDCVIACAVSAEKLDPPFAGHVRVVEPAY